MASREDTADDSIPEPLRQGGGCFGSVCTTGSKYTKVGMGQGDFGVHVEYRYVGEGLGDHEKQEAAPPSAGFPYRTTCIFLAMLAALFLGIGLLSAIVRSLLSRAAATTTTVQYRAAAKSFNCLTGFNNFEHLWTEPQKEWCCKNQDRACKPPPPPDETTTSGAPQDNPKGFVCSDDRRWRAWPEDKREFCCSTTGYGCPTVVGEESSCATYCDEKGWAADCATRVNWAADNTAKDATDACGVAHQTVLTECPACRECLLQDTGCKDTNSKDYDCEYGKEDPSRYWSAAKKAWCCQFKQLGCPQQAGQTQPPGP